MAIRRDQHVEPDAPLPQPAGDPGVARLPGSVAHHRVLHAARLAIVHEHRHAAELPEGLVVHQACGVVARLIQAAPQQAFGRGPVTEVARRSGYPAGRDGLRSIAHISIIAAPASRARPLTAASRSRLGFRLGFPADHALQPAPELGSEIVGHELGEAQLARLPGPREPRGERLQLAAGGRPARAAAPAGRRRPRRDPRARVRGRGSGRRRSTRRRASRRVSAPPASLAACRGAARVGGRRRARRHSPRMIPFTCHLRTHLRSSQVRSADG